MPEEDFLAVNGIDADTGEYLRPDISTSDLAALARGTTLEKRHLRELKARTDDPDHFGPIEGVDPKDLGQSGWAVIFPFREDARRTDEIREALSELLDHRRAQTEWYRDIHGPDGYRPDESKRDFLRRFDVGAGPAPTISATSTGPAA